MHCQQISTDDRRYIVSVDDDEGIESSESGLMAAWKRNVPDIALRVRGLEKGQGIEVLSSPRVLVRRLR